MNDILKRFLLLVLTITGMACAKAYAIEATGEGINQRQALNAALKQAVERSLGTQIEANTLVENFQVVRQQILNHTKGYVKSYAVLKEETPSQGLVRVTIDAEVDNQSLQNSTTALATLMKMANHPRVLVAGIDDDFDAVSSLSDEFRILSESVEAIIRDDFKFNVLDSETTRLRAKDRYRHSDRKNILKRALQAKAAYVVFVEVLKGTEGPFILRLEGTETNSGRALAKEEINFAMTDWTRDIKNNQQAILAEAREHIFAPSAQIASAFTETLKKEVYEDGQRYELSFLRFDEKTIKFMETDLANLSGYVRHELQGQKKNALTLSYWSLLGAGPLNEEISNLLKQQDITFVFNVQGANMTYRYNDPMFE